MFLGHYAAAMAAKKLAPNVNLGLLILAGQLLDLIWPIFLLLGFEHVRIDPGNTKVTPLDFYHYPFTHSLTAVLLWALGFALIYFIFKRQKKAAVILGLLVLSHWGLDLLVHRPDLPLNINGQTMLGFGLWNSFLLTLILEFGLFIFGGAVYLKSTQTKDRAGKYAFWAMIIFLGIIYILNLTGSPPPSAKAIGYIGLAAWLFVPWGYYIDRHRQAK